MRSVKDLARRILEHLYVIPHEVARRTGWKKKCCGMSKKRLSSFSQCRRVHEVVAVKRPGSPFRSSWAGRLYQLTAEGALHILRLPNSTSGRPDSRARCRCLAVSGRCRRRGPCSRVLSAPALNVFLDVIQEEHGSVPHSPGRPDGPTCPSTKPAFSQARSAPASVSATTKGKRSIGMRDLLPPRRAFL